MFEIRCKISQYLPHGEKICRLSCGKIRNTCGAQAEHVAGTGATRCVHAPDMLRVRLHMALFSNDLTKHKVCRIREDARLRVFFRTFAKS